MKRSFVKYFYFLPLLMAAFCMSCGKSGSKPDEGGNDGFDKAGMLVNYADNLIIPAFEQMLQKLEPLDAAVNMFLTDPDAANQNTLKTAFRDAFLQIERISVLQFGPADDISLNSFINMLPSNTMKKVGIDKPDLTIMEENITSGNWNLVSNAAIHQQGFPALDYLLFSTDAVEKFADAGNTNRKKYVRDLMVRIKELVGQTLSAWKNSYRNQFISNTGSNSGSPISYLLNQFSFEMDMLKGPRIGYPFGSQSGGVQFPELCEGYYSGLSLELAIENMTSLKTMFSGANSGKGISDLLAALGNTQLKDEIMGQFDVVINKLKAIPTPLPASLVNNKPVIEDAAKEIQLLLRLIKTDAVSKLGVQISYVDNDGD